MADELFETRKNYFVSHGAYSPWPRVDVVPWQPEDNIALTGPKALGLNPEND